MSNDFVKPLAKAIADNAPDLHDVAKRQLSKIDEERSRLNQQALAIKSLLALYPAKTGRVVIRVDAAQPPPEVERLYPEPDPNLSRLSDEQREIVRNVIRENWSPRITAEQVVSELDQRGVRLGVARPASVVGTILYHMRREREKSSGASNDSGAKP